MTTDAALARIDQEFLLVGRYLAAVTRREGQLERSALTLLACLDAGGAMTLAELTATLGLDTSTLNRQTASLVRSGLAERIPDPDGGIARRFRITADGLTRLREERAHNRDALARVLGDWPDADVDAFAAALERFNADIERRSGRRWPRRAG